MKQKRCFGRTPETIKAVRPLKDGVIADFQITEILITHFINEQIAIKINEPIEKYKPKTAAKNPSSE